ncbi:hypothetical protein RHMOL_Rhmol11G0008800 [Rhododendron molle]|uniref:Uncharacterized protein n=1 Tax=Rhododendron molle TaxID=49168 RepID=A0ACC0LM80_RHOML|nr:hypothetical protein RHMOL_Rhmol11G0008800 [Rhododendron molle]
MALHLEKMEAAIKLVVANWDTIDYNPPPIDPVDIKTSMAGTSGQWREWPKKHVFPLWVYPSVCGLLVIFSFRSHLRSFLCC